MDIELLWKPYSKDGATLEACHKWLCGKLGFSPVVAQQAIAEIMQEVGNGKSYLGKCDCGCSNTDVHNKINHAMAARAREIVATADRAAMQTLQRRFNSAIEAELKKLSNFDKEFIKMNQPPISERSPVLRFIKKVLGK